MTVIESQVYFTPETTTRGESEEARFIEGESTKSVGQLRESKTGGTPYEELFSQFISVARQRSVQDWDGYGATPLNEAAIAAACQFACLIPLGFGVPSIGAEPDGHMTFEWYSSPFKTLSVSVDPQANLHYAALIDSEQKYATVPFVGVFPPEILQLIYRVAQ
jgi:hypothetical protein